MNIFERTKIRLKQGKDFSPEMIMELMDTYDTKFAEIIPVLETLKIHPIVSDNGCDNEYQINCNRIADMHNLTVDNLIIYIEKLLDT